jgi:hypoxanthine-DNA glycosylase
MGEYQTLVHTFEPVYNSESKVLILGTFPSVKSREGNFYYHHPQNRFWKVLAALVGEGVPVSVEDKKAMVLRNHIALWDCIRQCDIIGSSDSSIKNVTANDLSLILYHAPIQGIFTNGKTAEKLYRRYCDPFGKRESFSLPSTSPANAAYSLERLIAAWDVVRKQLTGNGG